jgi:hypothetical protein
MFELFKFLAQLLIFSTISVLLLKQLSFLLLFNIIIIYVSEFHGAARAV